ncbi:MAG TPA: AraC family transcriptional regulator ligand-binding domain-containing protein [Roseiarcus sp.]
MPDPVDLRSTTNSYFQLIVRLFGDGKARRAAILDGTGVSEADLDDPNTEIQFAQQMRQLENMTGLFGEGWVLEAPQIWRAAAHSAFGVAVTSAPDARSAIDIMVRYISVGTPNQRLKLVRGHGSVSLRHSLAIALPERQDRMIVEIVFLGVASMLAMLLARDQSDVGFDFTWPAPAYAEKFKDMLGGQVRYNARSNEVVIPTRLLNLRSPLSDPALCRNAVERLELFMRQSVAPGGVKSRIEGLLARSDTGRMSSSVAARALGLSQRTLVRRLADADVTYRDLVDVELKARARRWLDSGTLSRAEIGERLGFADATGFSRACRRWFRADA